MTILKRGLGTVLVGLTFAAALPAAASDAAVVVRAPTFTTAAGGSFDVAVDFTGSEPPFAITGYFIDLRVTRLSGTGTLSLTGGGVAATNPVGLTPEFFATQGVTPPGGNFNAHSDSGTFTVTDGSGLFSASFAVTGTGTFGLSFVTDGGDASALNSAVNPGSVPPIEFAAGTVTVTVVPEPASGAVAAVLAAPVFLRRRARSR